MEDKGKSVASLPEQEEMEMLRKRMRQVEEEAEMIRAKIQQVEEECAVVEEPTVELSQAEKEEIDSRSVYVGNVEYKCTAEEVQEHFESCGIINRVTILTNENGTPKGYAFVEFSETESVQKALDFNGSKLHDREIKVSLKRTNIPGMSRSPSQRPFRRGPLMAGRFPRYKPNMRYRPY